MVAQQTLLERECAEEKASKNPSKREAITPTLKRSRKHKSSNGTLKNTKSSRDLVLWRPKNTLTLTMRRHAPTMMLWALLLLLSPATYAWISHSHSGMRNYDLLVSKTHKIGLARSAPRKQPAPALFSKKYDLGLGKNQPKGEAVDENGIPLNATTASVNWIAPSPVEKPPQAQRYATRDVKPQPYTPQYQKERRPIRTKKIVARTEESRRLRGAVWDEEHYQASLEERESGINGEGADVVLTTDSETNNTILPPELLYADIDLSIPSAIYSEHTDAIWELLRYEAFREAQREPLLVSFLYSTILNHNSLESALAFHLANRLSSPAMISTQIQALILEALENSPEFRKSLRADVMAVRDRDPACTCLPDAFLYFKGFAALQAYR